MCGIIGFFNYKEADKLALAGLKTIKNRGKDYFGIADEQTTKHHKDLSKLNIKKTNNCLAHNLHAIVNCIPQPFHKGNSKLSINGEIYNWEELKNRYNLKAKNDAELVFQLLEKNGMQVLDELDGVYALAYWKGKNIFLARDIIGVKPLWFALDDRLAFCSEKKALIKNKIQNVEELNPRIIIKYNIETQKTEIIKRKFFDILPEHKESHKKIIEKVKNLLKEAIKKRIPDQKFGILFSGGIDSTFIALVCKQLKLNFTCYTASLKDKTEAPDLTYAKRVAEELNLDLKYKEVTIEEIPKYLKKLVPLIEDSNVVKVGVGLTFYIACELAKKDKIRVIFSGLGSEELFAGYERHKKSLKINEECLSGIRKIYERDMYRDDVITMNNNIELRLPFLDKKLTSYALKIPAKYKLNNNQSKIILREAAREIGLNKEFSERPKKAAQYGSRFDKALIKLAKKSKERFRSPYLRTFYPLENLKLAALISGGKDSFYAMHIMQKQNYEISCLITIQSKNPDSYMYHTPNIELTELQSQACNIPLIIQKTKGEKEKELEDLEKALKKAKKEYQIQGVVSGALFSNYQRERIEKVCDNLGLKIFSPLWHMNQELEMRNLIEEGFKFILSSIAADGLDKSWLGRPINNKDIDNLVEINKKIGLNIAGEGGEFESLILDAPFFKKRIQIKKSKIVMENQITGKFLVKKAVLTEK